MKKLLIFSLLFCSTAYACDSYEECMDVSSTIFAGKKFGKKDYVYVETDGANAAFRAIAFKLDEISKKLDKKDEAVK